MKAKYGNLPEIEVDETEFIRIMMENGHTEEKAKLQASMAKGLGSSVMVGDKMVKIKDS